MDKHLSSFGHSKAAQPHRPRKKSSPRSGDSDYLRSGAVTREPGYSEKQVKESSQTRTQYQYHHNHVVAQSFPRESSREISPPRSEYQYPSDSQFKPWSYSDNPWSEPRFSTGDEYSEEHFNEYEKYFDKYIDEFFNDFSEPVPSQTSEQPNVPYYGLENAMDLLTSINLPDHVGNRITFGGIECPAYVDVARDVFGFRVTALLYDLESHRLKHVWIYDRPDINNVNIHGGGNISANPQRYLSRRTRYRTFKPPKAHMPRQAFHCYRYGKEEPIQPKFQDTPSVESDSSPPHYPHILSLPGSSEPRLWGSKTIAMWKRTCGRHKEWRCCAYIKAPKGLLTWKSALKRSWPTELSSKPFLNHLPITVLRRDTSFRLRPSVRARKASGGRDAASLGHLMKPTLWDYYDNDMHSDDGVFDALETPSPLNCPGEWTMCRCPSCMEWMVQHIRELSARGSFFNSSVPTDNMPVGPCQRYIIPRQITIPYENFIGAILGSCFRLFGLLRNESHGDVYAAEDLGLSSHRYEAKAYILRGITSKLYDYRVRNLKRLSAKSSFVYSLDQNGRKFIVNMVEGKSHGFCWPSAKKLNASKGSKLGAIGRRNTPEFDEAFPRLSKPCSFQNPETFNTTEKMGDILACLKSQTTDTKTYIERLEGFVKSLGRLETPEVQVPGSPTYASVLRSGPSVGTGEPRLLNRATALNGNAAVKAKTPRQRERNRERQRQSRLRKREQKRASSSGENADAVDKI